MLESRTWEHSPTHPSIPNPPDPSCLQGVAPRLAHGLPRPPPASAKAPSEKRYSARGHQNHLRRSGYGGGAMFTWIAFTEDAGNEDWLAGQGGPLSHHQCECDESMINEKCLRPMGKAWSPQQETCPSVPVVVRATVSQPRARNPCPPGQNKITGMPVRSRSHCCEQPVSGRHLADSREPPSTTLKRPYTPGCHGC